MLSELVEQTRTFRRFTQHKPIPETILRELIDLARLGGSARNCQPWQYAIITNPGDCARIFPYLGWAGYLSDWKGPVPGEQPPAYIICLLNHRWLKGTAQEAQFDLGIATQNLLLGAMEKGIGGCRIGAFNPKLAELFECDEHIEISLVLALGYPAEEVIIESCESDDGVKYWRDADDIHHVPKRKLEDILLAVNLS